MRTRPAASQHGRRSATRPVAPGTSGERIRVSGAAASVPFDGRPLHGRPLHNRIAIGVMAIAIAAGLSIAPTQGAYAEAPEDIQPAGTQTLDVDAGVKAPVISRDELGAQDGVQTYSANGTNEDWAKLVLLFGNWPETDQNVTAIMRWMRQENSPPDWWNRNNPLNNGYGSGGGSGLGSYPDLVTAAKYAAENLQRGYPDIVAALAAGTSTDAVAQAIWASPWSTSHYGNGTHWSTAPVEVVTAPATDW